MHVVFDESNSLDPRKDICVDDDIGELMEENIQEENPSKPLELEESINEEKEETPQPFPKDDLSKDWQFKKEHP